MGTSSIKRDLVAELGKRGKRLEIESLFSGGRWEIIKALSHKKLSPIELADHMKTTSANVSQQLRLLELGGLVKSERTSNTEKGKPRIVYSLNGDNSFLILASPNYSDKRLLALTSYHKFMMRTWFLENIDHHILLTELYCRLKDQMDTVKVISVSSTIRELVVYLVAESAKSQETVKKLISDMKKVRFVVLDLADYRKKASEERLTVLYDPSGLILNEVGRSE